MRKRLAALAFVGLAAAAVTLTGAAPAQADPVVPCWSNDTPLGSYYNLTYKNCGTSTVTVRPYNLNLGYWDPCKTAAPGQWVSWTGLPVAFQGWEARAAC